MQNGSSSHIVTAELHNGKPLLSSFGNEGKAQPSAKLLIQSFKIHSHKAHTIAEDTANKGRPFEIEIHPETYNDQGNQLFTAYGKYVEQSYILELQKRYPGQNTLSIAKFQWKYLSTMGEGSEEVWIYGSQKIEAPEFGLDKVMGIEDWIKFLDDIPERTTPRRIYLPDRTGEEGKRKWVKYVFNPSVNVCFDKELEKWVETWDIDVQEQVTNGILKSFMKISSLKCDYFPLPNPDNSYQGSIKIEYFSESGPRCGVDLLSNVLLFFTVCLIARAPPKMFSVYAKETQT